MSDAIPASGRPRLTDAQIRALPKAELHVHLEGAVEPSTIADLARRNGVDLGVDDPADLYSYDGLDDFLRVFDLVCRSLRTADDLHRVTFEALEIAAAAGVRYREMFFSPAFLMRHGVDFATIWRGIAAGLRDAESEHGIVARMILDVHKPAGPGAAGELIELAATCDRDVLIGIGGDGGEGVDLRSFADPFRQARRLGFSTTMHVGEEGPVDDVAAAVRSLHVDRIDHGLPLVDDPILLAEVAERRIPVTCCPTSNRAIGLIERIADHPIMQMRAAGVVATVNSDNAEMFHVDVADEFCALREAFDLDDDFVVELCLSGLDASWLDESARAGMRARFESEIEDVLAGVGS